jgi:hypothetical protein
MAQGVVRFGPESIDRRSLALYTRIPRPLGFGVAGSQVAGWRTMEQGPICSTGMTRTGSNAGHGYGRDPDQFP